MGLWTEDIGTKVTTSTCRTAQVLDDGRPVGAGIVSKWSMSTRAEIYDGQLQRGAASFGSPSPPLPSPFLSRPVPREVFSSGTVDTISQVEDRDVEARAVRSRGSGPGHPQPLRSSPLLLSSSSPLLSPPLLSSPPLYLFSAPRAVESRS